MRVAELWRHPVKSLQGERLDETEVLADGVRFDREWGVRDETTGRILTARRRPELLLASATVDEAAGAPVITLPDGTAVFGAGDETDRLLSDWLGTEVRLVTAAAEPASRAEYFEDATDDSSEAIEWTMPEGRFVDAMALLVLTTASLRAGRAMHPAGDWDTRRFRANVVIEADDQEAFVEDAWIRQDVAAGDVTLVPRGGCVRCTMVTRPQPGLGRDLDVYRALLREHGGTFGVWSTVSTPGRVRVGDEVTIAPRTLTGRRDPTS